MNFNNAIISQRNGEKMLDIVWYGAGKNISDYENLFLEETGYPVCICDKSEEKQ